MGLLPSTRRLATPFIKQSRFESWSASFATEVLGKTWHLTLTLLLSAQTCTNLWLMQTKSWVVSTTLFALQKLWHRFHLTPPSGSRLTLNIPEIVNVKLDVWDSSRNSATLIMNARKQPNTIMAMVIQRVELSWALNNFGDRAKCCPAEKVE